MLKYILLLVVLHGSAALDGWTTHRYFERYATQRDLNPLVRIGQNTPAVYLTTQVDALAVDALGITGWGKRHPRVMVVLEAGVVAQHLTLANYNAASLDRHVRPQTLPIFNRYESREVNVVRLDLEGHHSEPPPRAPRETLGGSSGPRTPY